jgi:nucleoside-diphosphate-sugar epimerase
MKPCALVTGAAGFVGRHLVPMLNQKYDVYGFDPKFKPAGINFASYFREHVENYAGYNLFPEFEIVVHLAANIFPLDTRMTGSHYAYQDIALDWEMAKWMAVRPPKKAFVYMSSCAIETPADPYAWVKLTGERFFNGLHLAGVPIVILRPFSGYGEDQDKSYPFPAILGRVLNGDNPVEVWGSGYQIRDWIHVDDIARAIMWSIDAAPRGIPIDIGTGIGTSIRKLAGMIANEAKPEKETEIKPNLNKPESGVRRVADTTLASKNGFVANISLEAGIRAAVEQRRHVQVA